MGHGSTLDSQSPWKRRWSMAMCSLVGLQMTGICWSDDVAIARVKQPVSRAVTADNTVDSTLADEVTQVGHRHASCNDPNCQQCRPRKRKWCPPDWYMESPLWQSMTTNNGTGAAGGQGMAAGNQGADANGAMNNTTPSFGEFASANTSNLAPNIIGDLFGQNSITVTGISAPQGNALLDPNQNFGQGQITVLHQVNNLNQFENVIYAPLNSTGGPGDVLAPGVQHQSGIIGSQTQTVLYKFILTGQNVAVLAVDSHGNPITTIAASLAPGQGPGGSLYQVNQFNSQASAVSRVGQLRIAENVSPMPRDRVFLNYSYFQDAQFSDAFQADVNRLTPGFEKTFSDGNGSFELRAPFATSLDPLVTLGGVTNANKMSFGNLNMTAKFLLYRTDTSAFSTGMQVVVPTARDTRIEAGNGGQDDARIFNRSTHVMPFAGFVNTPNDRFFSQGLVQLDVDVNGNPVFADRYLTEGPGTTAVVPFMTRRIGKLQDTTSLYNSFSMGYWIYRADSSDGWLQALAPVMEIHNSTSLQHSDFVQNGLFEAGSKNRHTEVTNLVFGVHTQLRDRRFISAAYAFPITGQADRQFQGEFRLLLNQMFGPVTRQTAAGFFGN